ncbi:MAG: FkbM family methyltransferase [Patescibacteria group bacterium]
MKSLLKNSLQSIYLRLKSKNLWEFFKLYIKYAHAPRYKFKKITFLNYSFEVPDSPSFLWQFKDIFVDETYNFNTDLKNPVIYDCGANIGTSVLYFKKIYPKAKIKAFEADPKIVKILKTNLVNNKITDVEINDKAVWIDDQGVEFSSQGADGGSIMGNDKKIKIASVKLKDLIEKEEQVDLLKIDIEGTEIEIIEDCADILKKVKNIFIEYHSWNNQNQKLQIILKTLNDNNFRYYIQSLSNRKQPLINRGLDLPMDLQLNIFAYQI